MIRFVLRCGPFCPETWSVLSGPFCPWSVLSEYLLEHVRCSGSCTSAGKLNDANKYNLYLSKNVMGNYPVSRLISLFLSASNCQLTVSILLAAYIIFARFLYDLVIRIMNLNQNIKYCLIFSPKVLRQRK